jgi:signal transduction histidine kinase
VLTRSFEDEEAKRPPDRRVRNDAQRDRARLGVLADVSLLLASSGDHVTILHKLTELAVPVLADSCAVYWAGDSGELERVAMRGSESELVSADLILRIAAHVFAQHTTEWADRMVSVPLVVRGRVSGVLTLVRAEGGDTYDRDDAAFAEELARRVAMYIDNAMQLREGQARESALRDEVRELVTALEKSHHDLDQFAYVTSHDLRAPLRGIANLGQWMEEDLGDKLTDKSREYLHLLRGRIRRLEDLIQGVLDYSRAGRVADAPTNVDVGELVREVVDRIGRPKDAVIVIAPHLPTLHESRAAAASVHELDRQRAQVQPKACAARADRRRADCRWLGILRA